MRNLAGVVVNPFPSAIDHGIANLIKTNMAIVIATNGQHRSQLAQRANQITKTAHFRGPIDQIPAQQDRIGFRMASGFDDLPTQRFRTLVPKMNIAHIHQATRIVPRRQPFLTNMKSLLEPDFQQSGRQS